MRAYVPDFDITVPDRLDEALKMLAEKPGFYRPLAGGTDLMVVFNAGHQIYKNFLSLHKFQELHGIHVTDEEVEIRALATYTDVRYHPILKAEFPMLCQAAAESGAGAIQNRGTIGGNIGNGSPAADTPPALAAYGAEIDLISKDGVRSLPFRNFQTGYKQMDLRPEELIRGVRLKRKSGRLHSYRKVGTRKAQAISKVCFAATVRLESGKIAEAGIVYGSVAPTVGCCEKLEQKLVGLSLAEASKLDPMEVKKLAGESISPIDDIRSSGEYRLKVAKNLAADFVSNLENLNV
ncbi:MAG TPA: carbon monoxide dehydrogenase [Phycisphaerales bacterium]|nr:carbon monoxide dehydrogenase [Phycisphaerales bacterium]